MAGLSYYQYRLQKGSSSSGNFGHAGRPGLVGGSSSSEEKDTEDMSEEELDAEIERLQDRLDKIAPTNPDREDLIRQQKQLIEQSRQMKDDRVASEQEREPSTPEQEKATTDTSEDYDKYIERVNELEQKGKTAQEIHDILVDEGLEVDDQEEEIDSEEYFKRVKELEEEGKTAKEIRDILEEEGLEEPGDQEQADAEEYMRLEEELSQMDTLDDAIRKLDEYLTDGKIDQDQYDDLKKFAMEDVFTDEELEEESKKEIDEYIKHTNPEEAQAVKDLSEKAFHMDALLMVSKDGTFYILAPKWPEPLPPKEFSDVSKAEKYLLDEAKRQEIIKESLISNLTYQEYQRLQGK